MKTLLTVLTAMMFYAMTPSPCHAQWKGDGTQRWESSVPYEPLSTLPQLHSDMPLDCVVAYIVMDSVARSIADSDYIRSFPQSTTLDTLKLIARFYYSAHEYDPLLLRRYFINTENVMKENQPHSYLSKPSHLYWGMWKALQANMKLINESGSAGYSMLLDADYIVKVQVNDVVRGADVTYSNPLSWINYSCSVLDTIKGMYLPNTCAPEFYFAETSGQQTQEVAPWETGHCLIYGHKSPQVSGKVTDAPVSSHIIEPEPGDEAYLFLIVAKEKETLSIRPLNVFEQTGGIFLVRNGLVLDPDNFWGLGTAVVEATFRTHIDKKINEIKSWWIH